MNLSTLRWLCTLGCACILALVKQPASKSPGSTPAPASSAAQPGSPTLQPLASTSKFLVPDSAPSQTETLNSPPAASPQFPQPAANSAPAPLFSAVAKFLPAAFKPSTPFPSGPVSQFVPVALSASPPEPAPAPQFQPTVQTTPAPEATLAAAKTLPVAALGAGLTGLPELSSDGYWIENAPLNEIFQYLARRAEQQYFFNNDLAGPEFTVTGHLKLTEPKKQMEDLATAYGLTVYEQGSTIYLMTDAQLAKLPVEVLCYPLKYLRGAQPNKARGGSSEGGEGGEGGGGGGSGAGGADFTKLLAIIKPMLTRELGHIEFEEKNNILLVSDNGPKLKKVRAILEEIDRPKQQIAINVRILRVKKTKGSRIGVDWSKVLGDGLPVAASQSLNAVFGLPDSATLTKSLLNTKDITTSFIRTRDTSNDPLDPFNITRTNDTFTNDTGSHSSIDSLKSFTDGAGLVFDVLQMEAIVHALRDGQIVTQESCPTIITEDNEQGIISIVDRFPLITSDVVATTGNINITDKVRYKIDEEDPNSSNEPEKSREIGVTLSVTPTLLPDGTVRMRLRPRVANIVDFIPGKTGNVFPRVSESTIEGISRIPQGKSLFLGGFYDSNDSHKNNAVPFLGSLPLLNKLFSYKDKSNEQICLVFIITPQVYDASNTMAIPVVNRQVQMYSGFNRTNPMGPATPLLPDPRPDNDELPLPVDREVVTPPPGDVPPPERRRSWFGRIFSRKPPVAEAAWDGKAPAATTGPRRSS